MTVDMRPLCLLENGHAAARHLRTTRQRCGVLLLALVIAGCNGSGTAQDNVDDDGQASAETETLPTPVEVAVVAEGDIAAVYTGTATLEADGEAEIMAKVGGELVALLVNEGDTVAQGQPVARMDDRRLRLEVRRTRANLDKTRQDYQRNLELHEKGLLPAGTYEGLKYDLDALAAAHELAKLELSHATVRAPFAGTISERLVKAGNTIPANSPVFRLTDLDPLVAYLYVPEREFSKLGPGQPVGLSLDALPDRQFTGHVARISPVIDPQTATFKVTVELDDSAGRLKPGMFGRLSVEYERRENVPLVPRVALLADEVVPSVYVVEDGVALRREIVTGYSSNGYFEVVDGLVPGDQVVVIGQSGLKPNSRVHVIPPGESVARIQRPDDA
ncbi:MAG: efflux RND transporter periplasmic adaptor subunit [Pseudomonadota bacterium]